MGFLPPKARAEGGDEITILGCMRCMLSWKQSACVEIAATSTSSCFNCRKTACCRLTTVDMWLWCDQLIKRFADLLRAAMDLTVSAIDHVGLYVDYCTTSFHCTVLHRDLFLGNVFVWCVVRCSLLNQPTTTPSNDIHHVLARGYLHCYTAPWPFLHLRYPPSFPAQPAAMPAMSALIPVNALSGVVGPTAEPPKHPQGRTHTHKGHRWNVPSRAFHAPADTLSSTACIFEMEDLDDEVRGKHHSVPLSSRFSACVCW